VRKALPSAIAAEGLHTTLQFDCGIVHHGHNLPDASKPLSMNSVAEPDLRNAVAARFYAVNGRHPMTADDDGYARKWYVSIEELARDAGVQASELRRLILANRLPLPSYILTDGTQMVARDLLELPRRAGGYDELPEWFAQHFESTRDAIREWDGYLRGHYVCLRHVLPETIRRKEELVKAIKVATAEPRPDDHAWLETLHRLVDELDTLEPPFAAYDRLRFGGPLSRDTCIDAVRERFPRPVPRADL
jgi:Family of unknown function (DUF6058)